MNDSEYQRLIETAWNRPLSPEEDALLNGWLEEHPEARSDWAVEKRLNRILHELPDAPLSTNFTAQVMLALDQELKTSKPRRVSWIRAGLSRGWLPRLATVGLVLALGGAFYWNHEQKQQAQLARSLNIASTMSVLPTPVAFKEFEVINTLAAVPPATADLDLELLAALE